MEEGRIDDVARRLPIEEPEPTRSLRGEGVAAGREWAINIASLAELKRLDDWYDPQQDMGVHLASHGNAAVGENHYLARVISGDDHLTRAKSDEFWYETIGPDDDRHQTHEFLCGFVEGTVPVIEDVRTRFKTP